MEERKPDLTKPRSREKSVKEILLEPYEYLAQCPGKGIRPLLLDAFNHWLQVPEEKLDGLKEVTQMLHNASLLIDDIEDFSKLRRGIPVAHAVFGIPHVINSANYVYFMALDKITQMGNIEAVKIFTGQLLELHTGQAMDIQWRDSCQCPSEEQYKAMVIQKTGGLFKFAVDFAQLFSNDKRNFQPLLDILSLWFQIRDDYCNLQSEEYAKNKTFADDITEGKFSFPVVHGVNHGTKGSQILNILRRKTEDLEVKKYAVDCLEEAGSFEYTRSVLQDLETKLLAEVERLGGNPYLIKIVSHLESAYKVTPKNE
ncbi:geranylgeranyl pyrophosphate synthase-like [Oscarella lobularis]|uniref:geranylgeranyl pyrophosphate synthase-like n=1 Tax=Oscarella lobularis TaxID=121494 RepID=UPI00331338BB